jgi:pimeloyl-ACP methyl ester carboxylesterase
VFCSWCRSNLVAGSGGETEEKKKKKRKKKIVVMGVSKPAHFVFVHGGGHGAWCWYKTVDLLRLAGHKATAVDLVSCGRDSTDPNHVESFLDYNEPLMELLSNLPDDDKVLSVRRRRRRSSSSSTITK